MRPNQKIGNYQKSKTREKVKNCRSPDEFEAWKAYRSLLTIPAP